MGRYLSIALTRTFRKGRLGDKPSKGTLLRVGGGMACYLFVEIISHPEKEYFVGCLLMSCHLLRGLFLPS